MKNKKSKKIMIVGAMAALLTLIGVTGSETYAKYYEEASAGSHSATVAKWGMVVTANTQELFASEYELEAGTKNAVKANGGTLIVDAASKAVAPGCTGSITFGVSGSAEVSSQLTFEVTGTKQIALLKNSVEEYRPLLWTLTENGTKIVEGENDFSKVVVALGTVSKVYAPGDTVSATYTLSYSWPFESGKDLYDTYLGKLAAGGAAAAQVPSEYTIANEVSFGISFSISQVQTA